MRDKVCIFLEKIAIVCVELRACFVPKAWLIVSPFFPLFNLVEEKADAKV